MKSPRWGRSSLKDPVDYAKIRLEQNVLGNISECCYMRQTGRTFRTLLRALDAIEKRIPVLILADHHGQVESLSDILTGWIEEAEIVHVKRVSPAVVNRPQQHILDSAGRTLATIATLGPHLRDVTFGQRGYDMVLADNSLIDCMMSGGITEDHARALPGLERALTRKDLSAEAKSISDGMPWRSGDMFQLPRSSAVGSIMSVKHFGCIVTSLTVLYEGGMLELPWDTCDIFHRV